MDSITTPTSKPRSSPLHSPFLYLEPTSARNLKSSILSPDHILKGLNDQIPFFMPNLTTTTTTSTDENEEEEEEESVNIFRQQKRNSIDLASWTSSKQELTGFNQKDSSSQSRVNSVASNSNQEVNFIVQHFFPKFQTD
jgi:hypothetical protein